MLIPSYIIHRKSYIRIKGEKMKRKPDKFKAMTRLIAILMVGFMLLGSVAAVLFAVLA